MSKKKKAIRAMNRREKELIKREELIEEAAREVISLGCFATPEEILDAVEEIFVREKYLHEPLLKQIFHRIQDIRWQEGGDEN